ncbi:unnamed protein product [Cyclocybe aegerita]|uniref:Protein farnesyltransferase/geranylgeranyltransferase type-1 subunit alpha n=1 Tax=Cyclocybe aegerita TaxID=1973307 RepID=A0A8S0XMJ0_CYCAE|nr:unnamed protein product [Cyclocybe aegerita]
MATISFDDEELFSERPDWADVVPLEQYENISPLAPIFYTEEYKDATNYFRAIAKSGEKSRRVLELTESVIRQNPAHYSAWQYRYETLLALLTASSPSGVISPSDPLLVAEIELMDILAVRFLKTYQVWHHRRLLVALTRKPQRELQFITRSLDADVKNYHTWSYRQWLLAYFGGSVDSTGDEDVSEDLWEGELDFVDTMLAQDVRNNSAWHHRFFVVWGCGVREGERDRERVFKRELTFVKQNISLAPSNPSAWNYLRGILKHTSTPFASVLPFVRPYAVVPSSSESAQRDIVDLENPPPGEGAELPCAEALEFLADAYEIQGGADGVKSAVEIWTSLANKYDPIRKKYWEHRIRDAHQALKKANA